MQRPEAMLATIGVWAATAIVLTPFLIHVTKSTQFGALEAMGIVALVSLSASAATGIIWFTTKK